MTAYLEIFRPTKLLIISIQKEERKGKSVKEFIVGNSTHTHTHTNVLTEENEILKRVNAVL